MKSERTYIFCNSFLAKITEILMHYNFLEYIIKLCNFVTILVSLNIEINLRTSSLFTNMISYSKKNRNRNFKLLLSFQPIKTQLLCVWLKKMIEWCRCRLVVYLCLCLKKLGKYVRVQRRRIIFYVISRYFLEGPIKEFRGFEAIFFLDVEMEMYVQNNFTHE